MESQKRKIEEIKQDCLPQRVGLNDEEEDDYEYDLVGKLRSIKHYLLLDQSLLDIALRSTAAAVDPLHEDVTCSVFQDTCSLLRRLSTLKDLQTGETVVESDKPLSIIGVETFSVNYKILEGLIVWQSELTPTETICL